MKAKYGNPSKRSIETGIKNAGKNPSNANVSRGASMKGKKGVLTGSQDKHHRVKCGPYTPR